MTASILVRPWPDPVIDVLGFDPRSWYVERFWLPTLGPTALLLLRHLADRFDHCQEALTLPVEDTAAALGLGNRGSSPPLLRTLSRLELFDLSREDGEGIIAVRRTLPPVNRRHLRRLPVQLQLEHAEWAEAQTSRAPHDAARRRARRVALSLLGADDDVDEVERALYGLGFHPALCRDAASWAKQHRAELTDLAEDGVPRVG